MPESKNLPREISLLRIVAHRLVPSLACATPLEAVSHMLAMQGQQVSALPKAIAARCENVNKTDVAQAFNELALVRHRPMRGTVHVTAAKDYHWIRLALNSKPSTWNSRIEKEVGVNDEVGEKAALIAWDAIKEAGGSLPRKELFQRWMETLGAHVEESMRTRWCNVLMYRMDRCGYVVEAPMGKNEHYFVDARLFPSADSPGSGFSLREGEDKTSAYAEIARRYALSHGPVSIADLARWASMPISLARKALEESATSGNIGRYTLEEGILVSAKAPANPAQAREIYYMRDDLFGLLDEHRSEAERMMYLPSFDELHVGYKDRSCLTDAAGEKLICPAGNGMFRPLVIEKGRLVAVHPSQGVQWVGKPSARMVKAVERCIEQSERSLG